MSPKPQSPPIGLMLTGTAKVVGRAFDDALAEAGGSQPTWSILMACKANPSANQREIAAAVGIEGATLTHHLNGMESDGLLTRHRDPANRRVHVIELTERGEEAFDRMRGAAAAFDRRLRAGITAEDVARLRELLSRLRENAG